MAEVGFQSSTYRVMEGRDPIVTVCVSMFSGELADMVSLSYTVSILAQSATGKQLF